MLVYGTRLWFTAPTKFEVPLGVVARWLSRKVGRQLAVGPFIEGVDRVFTGNHQVRSVAALDAAPEIIAVCYSHPDAEIGGRQWTTEIGFRRAAPAADIECTVLLSTSEISARVAAPITVSRPGVVTELVRRCELANATTGSRIHTLDEDHAEAFRHVVLDRHRSYSLVVISPTATGGYLVDSSRLASQLLGLADIVTIPPGSDTFWLAKVVGADFVPYHGAVRLLYPPVKRYQALSVPTRLLTAADVARLAEAGTDPEIELLSLVVHRSNLPISWSHIGLQTARDVKTQRLLARKRDEAAKSGDAQEYAAFLETYAMSLEATVADHKSKAQVLEERVAAQDDKERELRFENDSLKRHLDQVRRRDQSESPDDADSKASFASAVASAIDGKVSPETCLRLIDRLFADRVTILPEAWQSARTSATFKYGQRLFGLLYTLATTYWQSLSEGRPDGEARAAFGASYAAKESETVENRKEARDRRTFEYQGRDILMLKHLKIGVKDSKAETIRVHFEWIPEDARIAIGHCGPHLPFK